MLRFHLQKIITFFFLFYLTNSSIYFSFNFSLGETSLPFIENLELTYCLEKYVFNQNGSVLINTFEYSNNNISEIIKIGGYEALVEKSMISFMFTRFNDMFFEVEINLVMFNYSWSGILYYDINEKCFQNDDIDLTIYCPIIVDFKKLEKTLPFATSLQNNYIEIFNSGSDIEIGVPVKRSSSTPFIPQNLMVREIKVYRSSDHIFLECVLNYESKTGILLSGTLPSNCFASIITAMEQNKSRYYSNPIMIYASSNVKFDFIKDHSSIYQILLYSTLLLGIPVVITILYIKQKKLKEKNAKIKNKIKHTTRKR